MSILSFFKKYITPHELDFVGMLQEQSSSTHKMIEDLYICFIEGSSENCKSIIEDEHRTKHLKNKNMNQLLNSFITPIDRESIYRTITQLDWITDSVKHFVLEVQAYEIERLEEYKQMFHLILKASRTLHEGFETLSENDQAKVSRLADKTRRLSEKASEVYINEMVILSKSKDFRKVFIHKEILFQLKDISKRIHITANTLQDIVVKMD